MERRKTGRSRLTIPNDLAYLSAVRAYVREIARMAGFAEEEIGDIELGVDEAVTNVIQHGFEAGEEAVFDILCEQVPTRLEVIIREKGVPFDQIGRAHV
jgi:anti-sigma regulatory factor (Ser/Thr protein kinase)